MLRTLLLCFILFVLAVRINGQTPEEKLGAYFEQKCFNNTRNREVSAKLRADIGAFQSYLDHLAKLVPDDMKNFCSRERKQLSVRINEVSYDLKPCLTKDELYLADFMNISFNEVVHFMCHKDAKYTKRFFDDQCHKTILNSEGSELDSCFNRIFPLRTGTITKKELCSNMKIAKECLGRSLDKLCPSNKNFQELNDKLFLYIGQPCSGCYHYYLNSLLLMLCVAVSSLFSR